MMNMTAVDGPAGDLAIRRATAADAEALSAFAATVFRETFAPDNDPMDMQAYLSDAFTPEKQAAEIADGSCVCFIAEVGERLAGYALLRIEAPDQRDPLEARPVARQLRAGTVNLNYPDWDTSAPFGGYKQSGNGREYADWGIHDFCEIKGIVGFGD